MGEQMLVKAKGKARTPGVRNCNINFSKHAKVQTAKPKAKPKLLKAESKVALIVFTLLAQQFDFHYVTHVGFLKILDIRIRDVSACRAGAGHSCVDCSLNQAQLALGILGGQLPALPPVRTETGGVRSMHSLQDTSFTESGDYLTKLDRATPCMHQQSLEYSLIDISDT